MENKRKDKLFLIAAIVFVAIFFVSAIAETMSYYNDAINDRNSKIANLNSEIANLNSQISSLRGQLTYLSGQVTNLTSAYLLTALGATEVSYNSGHNMTPTTFNHLYITGSVTNTGEGTAYNAGLHIVAYDATGGLDINMTVPLDGNGEAFGTDSGINAWVSSNFGNSSLQLGLLYSRQTATIALGIFHEGNATNWTVTPVWTNSP